jgi:hypothetical protein
MKKANTKTEKSRIITNPFNPELPYTELLPNEKFFELRTENATYIFSEKELAAGFKRNMAQALAHDLGGELFFPHLRENAFLGEYIPGSGIEGGVWKEIMRLIK